jgi:glycogen phosphorylase
LQKVHQFSVHPRIPERLAGLEELALNLRWTWDVRAYKLFQHLDAEMLEKCGGNPVLLLRRIATERLEHAAVDSAFLTHFEEARADLRRYLAEPGWFKLAYPDHANLVVAYFCMEYGLTACLPIYSGGLGVLAGDHLKAASGLDLPLVAVGMLYNRGYFTQRLDDEGWQYEEYRAHDFSSLPITPVLEGETWRGARAAAADRDGGGAGRAAPLKISVEIAGRTVWARVWRVQIGRISLYLLDSSLPENDLAGQRITSELYGGGSEERLAQEILLGIGGYRMLRALGVEPQVCHLNEGHSVFSSLERMRGLMNEHSLSFYEARRAAGAGTLFTTHTPVSAGFDVFPEALIESHLGGYLKHLGLDLEHFMPLGRTNRENLDEEFSLAILALRQSHRRNAVSRLHRRVTAAMMEPGWVGYPRQEMPIESVTNGIHTKTWVAPDMAQLYDHYLGPRWREETWLADAWQRVERIPDVELWQAHARLRERLVAYAREASARQLIGKRKGASGPLPGQQPLRPNVLTIGFARRFATYKRATLLFRDIPRLKRILLDETRPVQLLVAGKAHPRDGAGKDFIRQLIETVRREGLEDHVLFFEDYDLDKAAMLVQGCDVWLNTPRRPNEACGTSGMKVVPNGGLNLSVLDGWWAEGYRPGVGWAIGDGQEYVHADYQDELDADSLYSLLENEVVPLFYTRDADGLPRGWIQMMKNSIRVLAPAFSGDRMVKQYAQEFYVPIGDRYERLAAGEFARTRELAVWRDRVREEWPHVRVASVEQNAASEVTVGDCIEVTARVHLGTLSPADVVVEAYAGGVRPDGTLRNGRGTALECQGNDGREFVYKGEICTASSGSHGFAVRVMPSHEDVLVPNELPLITWEES